MTPVQESGGRPEHVNGSKKSDSRHGPRLFLPLLIGLICFLSLTGCEKFYKKETPPAFIHIDAIDLKTDEASEGTDDHKIVDAWVFNNDNAVGAFELPATIPVFASGQRRIKVVAGIKNNGFVNDRQKYPLYKGFQKKMKLAPGKVDTIHPTVSYFPDLFFWIEDLESTGVQFESTDKSDTGLFRITQPPARVYEGDGSGKAHLTVDQDFLDVRTKENFQPSIGDPVYLELHYRINDTLTVGLIAKKGAEQVKRPKLSLKPKRDDKGRITWNKTYIEFTDLVSTQPNAESFELFLEVRKAPAVQEVEVFVDNVKLIYPDA